MLLTLLMWNTDGVGSSERELMELVKRTSPDTVILNELKTTSLLSLSRVWPRGKLESIPSKRQFVRSALRAALLVRPGLNHYVQFVREDIEDEANGVVPHYRWS